NVGHVTNYGCELLLSGRQNVGQHYFNLSASYAYTVSKDDDTGYQLVYVPFNKINTNLAYSYKRLTAAYQYLFNGYVFTSSDNYYFLKKYNLSNIAIDYAMGKKHNLKVGAQVLNLFNEKYQSTDQRPMPGRNYTINLTFKT
ncbi:MAG TPA: TonB-dependent receptor, partial [Ferruginibacter sp.]|nr:TonB-dependent receptor [Ferruginibacter sp.]